MRGVTGKENQAWKERRGRSGTADGQGRGAGLRASREEWLIVRGRHDPPTLILIIQRVTLVRNHPFG